MNKVVLVDVSVIMLVATFFVGLSIGKSDSTETKKSDSETTTTAKKVEEPMSTSSTTTNTMVTSEEALELDRSLPTPTVEIEVKMDTKLGYNLFVTTTNFKFRPKLVNMDEGKTPQNVLIPTFLSTV